MNQGKEITPRRRAVIIAFRSLDTPLTFQKIKEATGIPISTVHEIWQHAKTNAYNARQASGGLGTDLIDVPLSLQELIAHSALDPKARSGRPAVLSKEDKDRLIVFIKRDFYTRRMNMIDVQREADFAHVSLKTLLRALAEWGIGAYQEEFKPILTAENKEKRLKYCQEHELWLPARQWGNYGFTDEMAIEVGAGFGVQRVWREKGERWADDCVGTKKKHGILVMCWGAIGWNWKGPFYVWSKESKEEKAKAVEDMKEWNKKAEEEEVELNTAWRRTEEWKKLREVELAALRVARTLRKAAKEQGEILVLKVGQSWRAKRFKIARAIGKDVKGIDSWRYVTALCRPLLWPTCQTRSRLNPHFRLMEDNAPSHNSDFTNQERRREGIAKVDWPPNSPDFNPIEHIWRIMKWRILRRRGIERITTPGAMELVLKEEWERITIEEINHEIVKLPDIMVRCMAANGGNKFQA